MADDPKPTAVTRLGTPSAFILLAGLGLVYYALRGWDIKYRTFNGTFASASVPTATAVSTTVAPVKSVIGTA
jgi:hypothetical protein